MLFSAVINLRDGMSKKMDGLEEDASNTAVSEINKSGGDFDSSVFNALRSNGYDFLTFNLHVSISFRLKPIKTSRFAYLRHKMSLLQA